MTDNFLAEDPLLRANVQRGLDHLAARLQPIIAAKLAPELGGLPWTVILSQLDELRGRAPGKYSTVDLQAQLRVLTERLGGLGFPFDDSERRVSRLGGELRVARNSLAHGGSFEPIDAWRVHDACVRLLTLLGDAAGAQASAEQRDDLHRYLPGATKTNRLESAREDALPAQASALPSPTQSEEKETCEAPEEGTEPDRESFVRELPPTPQAIGGERLPFEPWRNVMVGEPETLDQLRRVSAKEQVRSVVAEIVEFEGPVHRERLIALVASAFGVGRLHARRAKAIDHQISRMGLHIDTHGFVWPEGQEPETWKEFRPSSDPDREFTHISPVELRNAAEFWRRRHPSDSAEEIQRRVLQTFGRRRLTRQFRNHLERTSPRSLGSHAEPSDRNAE